MILQNVVKRLFFLAFQLVSLHVVQIQADAGCTRAASLDNSSQWRRSCLIYIPGRQFYSVSCLLLCMLVVYTCGETQALKTGMLTELVIEWCQGKQMLQALCWRNQFPHTPLVWNVTVIFKFIFISSSSNALGSSRRVSHIYTCVTEGTLYGLNAGVLLWSMDRWHCCVYPSTALKISGEGAVRSVVGILLGPDICQW